MTAVLLMLADLARKLVALAETIDRRNRTVASATMLSAVRRASSAIDIFLEQEGLCP